MTTWSSVAMAVMGFGPFFGFGQWIIGGTGNDTLIAGNGDDQVLSGEEGDDSLQGGNGAGGGSFGQELYGGNGNDTLVAGRVNAKGLPATLAMIVFWGAVAAVKGLKAALE
jgi:Ca2+-binding RTX toxin-like protein